MNEESKENCIELQSLSVGYDDKALIGNINMLVKPGQIVCLIGPNGAGKSTILKTVATVLSPVSGVVSINGTELKSMSASDRAGLMSVMLTARPDTGYMTCFDVVSAGRYQFTGILGRLTDEDVNAVEKALENTGALDFKDRRFMTLSDGQKQRVLLARALVQEPEYMLLDEPTGFLDIGHKLEFTDALKTMVKERGIGVLMSMHELSLAKAVADIVVTVTDDNRIDMTGTPDEVIRPDYIEKLFGMKSGDYARLYGDVHIDSVSNGISHNICTGACDQRSRKTKVLMIQGTMSGVGKSLLTAGLCRLLTNEGFRVRPFKSQNMALNSFITEEGYEIGRAQAMQAEACRVSPSVYMNPVLLKPTGERSSQIIVSGKAVGNMNWAEFTAYKERLKPLIKDAYEKLEEEADIIIIEGAGSPAEINLKDNDIVNMGIAKLVDAPVLLVGDIDSGGVFAQLIGTLDLLESDERARVKGLVVNKFRGDREFFGQGVKMLEERCGVPVAGVVPFTSHRLEDEDSLAESLSKKSYSNDTDRLRIGVIRLPFISNFTDFYTFEQVEEVSLGYTTDPQEISGLDMLIIPGSKNTIGDMRWLISKGFDKAIRDFAWSGSPVFGICGGYQMLGLSISDPEHTEAGGRTEGLGLLPVDTVFSGEKKQTQVSGTISGAKGVLSMLNGAHYRGYEIHMGETAVADIIRGTFTEGGSGCSAGSVYGTYVHGIFDSAEVTRAVVAALAERKGVAVNLDGIKDYSSVKEADYDRLADVIRENMDMRLLYEILGLEQDGKEKIAYDKR